jgi:hypothetical protein
MDFFNPPLGVLSVGAHIPFAHRAVGAGNRIRTADDSYHQVALFEGTAWTWIDDATKGFMPQNQARLSRWRPTILPFDDLGVCPADTDCYRFNQYRAFTLIRLRNILVSC